MMIRFGLVLWPINNCRLFNHIYPTPQLGQDMTQDRFFFKRSLTGLNSEFSFS